MKIYKVYIQNFRGYKDKVEIYLENLTTLIGKNDVGKSTILEALDIFFNNRKLEKSDVNLSSDTDKIIIGVVFEEYPSKIILDSSVETTLVDEFLLNREGKLEVQKHYCSNKVETYLVANYPNAPLVQDIHHKKQKQLQTLVEKNSLVVENKTICSQMRKALFSSIQNPILEERLIQVDKEDTKKIWGCLEKYLPMYELFQADRRNVDQDGEIQNPMKVLIREVLHEEQLQKQLSNVLDEVRERAEGLASSTLDKLHEINAELANELKPHFEDPTWDKVFKFSLDNDSGVPLNKRGSGVRRLVLLSFFRAEVERRRNTRQTQKVIYAIEEPETALHPMQQKMLIESLLELANSNFYQLIITTHSPAIASQLPENSLRFIDKSNNNKVEIYDNRMKPELLKDVADCLGVLPNLDLGNIGKVKLAVCVEGKNDIEFLKILNTNVSEFQNLIDLVNDERVILIPMGGSTLQYWVNENYLEKLHLAQLHIYDSDRGSSKPNKYRRCVEKINTSTYGFGFETHLRELENYITPTILKEEFPGIDSMLNDLEWETLSVPELLARYTHSIDRQHVKEWDSLEADKQKKKIGQAKNKINTEIVKKINKDCLIKNGYYEEIFAWFSKACELLNL